MRLDHLSVTSFTTIDPDLYEITFTDPDSKEEWSLPVIGFAVVVTYAAKDETDLSETGILPVVLDEEGPDTLPHYLQIWGTQRQPGWVMRRKADTKQP